MKKITLFICILLASFGVSAQIVTTNPVFATESSAVDITFDATQGTAGLKDYTGDVYAHIGVITNKSTSDTDWKYGPSVWGDNAAKYKLTSLGNNKYKLSIAPSVRAYFGVPAGETIKSIAIVFRSADTSKEGKDTGGKNILVNIYEDNLNVSFTNPTLDQSVETGGSVAFTVAASKSATLSLLINNNSVATTTGTTLSYTHSFTAEGNYLAVAKAVVGSETVYDTLCVFAVAPSESAPRPTGVKDGINYINNNTVTLVLYAPYKTSVFAIGDFNNWEQRIEHKMKKDGDYWWVTITGLDANTLYGFQYFVDGHLRVSDAYTELVLDPWNDKWINENGMIFPNLKAYPEGKTEGLVATFQINKPAYNWQVTDFQMPEHENMVIYELLLRDFTPEKSLEGAMAKLDYLQYLGVTAIELMPIQEFDGNNSWGYNPNHYMATDKAYGTPEMYKKFVDECHKRGMAVIVDVVFNHATGINPFAKLYWDDATGQTAANNPWFNVKAKHPFNVFHDINHEFSGTRSFFKRVLEYWIKEYKIDGYRLDLSKGFTQNDTGEDAGAWSAYDQSRINILKDYHNATKAVKPDVMFILEHLSDYPEEEALANAGMYLWRNMNHSYSQAASGWQAGANFSGMNSLPRNWVGYAESHDEERNFFKAKSSGSGTIATNESVRLKRVAANIAFTTLIPGPKMIWQFGEMGYDISLMQGDKTGEKPSAFSSSLNYLNNANRKNAYEASAKTITMRKLYPTAFINGFFESNVADGDWNEGKRLAIKHNDLNMVALGNFKTNVAFMKPNFPKAGDWYELLTGAKITITSASLNSPIQVPAGDVRIYTDRPIQAPSGIESNEFDTSKDVLVYPISDSRFNVSASVNIKGIKVYNMQGALLKTVAGADQVDLSATPSGLYIFDVTTDSGRSQHKVIRK